MGAFSTLLSFLKRVFDFCRPVSEFRLLGFPKRLVFARISRICSTGLPDVVTNHLFNGPMMRCFIRNIMREVKKFVKQYFFIIHTRDDWPKKERFQTDYLGSLSSRGNDIVFIVCDYNDSSDSRKSSRKILRSASSLRGALRIALSFESP